MNTQSLYVFKLILLLLFQKIEARVSADEDLKLSDLLKYYLRESQAAKVNLWGFFVQSNSVSLKKKRLIAKVSH